MKKISFNELWKANKDRSWIKKLMFFYRGSMCKDKDTIDYWIEQIRAGAEVPTLWLSSRKTLEVGDGNHRLVAMYLSGYEGEVDVDFPGGKRQ